jgi:hypothetical protein
VVYTTPASRGVRLPLRVSRREPYRLFGSPDPPRRSLRSPSRLSGSRLPPPSYEDGASSHRLQTPYRDPIRRCPNGIATVARRLSRGDSSHEVSGPSSVRRSVSRLDARIHPDAFPPRCFAHPRGFDPHRPLRPCFMPLPLLGFRPSEPFPASELLRVRHPAIPSRCSSPRPEGRAAAPPGVCVGWAVRHPRQECCILAPDRCSPGFQRFHGVPVARAGLVSRRCIRS